MVKQILHESVMRSYSSFNEIKIITTKFIHKIR